MNASSTPPSTHKETILLILLTYAAMAAELPSFIVIRSTHSHRRFVRYVKDDDDERRRGRIRCDEESAFSPLAKIQVEPAKEDGRHVHLRFVHVNKYWAKPANDQFLVAASDQPDENPLSPTCTLFVPAIHSNGGLALRHVQSNRGIDVDSAVGTANADLLFAHNTAAATFIFSFLDWDTLVSLPTHLAFKGYNHRYVRGVRVQNSAHLQLSSNDANREDSTYEAQLMPDGHVRIKSLHFDRYWRRSPNWIWADNNDASGINRDTLFWPVQIDDNTIALRSAGNNHFIKPLTLDGKVNCLNAEAPNITLETRLVVQELVLERDIYNVRYRMEDARIYDEEPFLAGVATATNLSNKESSLAVTVAYEDSLSYTFTNSKSITKGVETKFEVGIPKIASGRIHISTEISKSLEWNRETTETKTVTAEHTMTVPPKSRAKVSYVGTHGKCSVPFNYTRRDKMSTNGQMITSQHVDGIYSGVNYYNFQFEVNQIEPL